MHRIRVALSAALAALFVVSAAAPALAAIRFRAIYYDPGSTALTNYNINKEYVVIKNTGTRAKYLTGWRLIDVRTAANGGNQVYKFPTFKLAAGAVVRVHSGKGTRTAHDLYWGLSHFVWGNSSDTAYLRNSSGTLIDTCGYSSATDPSPASC